MRLAILLLTMVCPLVRAAEPPLRPVTVCEIMQNLAAYDGKVVAVVGRFSARQTGRWLGEQKCERNLVVSDQQWPNAFWLVYDAATAPPPPAVLAVDAPLLAQKLQAVKAGTSLGKLRFGSGDTDAWAVVYGRVETRKDLVTVTAAGTRKNGFGVGESSPARLVCHSEAAVISLDDDFTAPASR